jgi:hypothetical protein
MKKRVGNTLITNYSREPSLEVAVRESYEGTKKDDGVP